MLDEVYRFVPYDLNVSKRILLCDNAPCHLTPTEFEILTVLARARGEIRDRHFLIREIWSKDPPANVENNLHQHLGALRRKLSSPDTGESWIRNIHGKGYYLAAQAATMPPGARRGTFVGRVAEQTAFSAQFREAANGHGRICTVTGEPGLGKTAFVERVLQTLRTSHPGVQIATGKCYQRLTATGAYLPIIDVLERLMNDPASAAVTDLLHSLAPNWETLIKTSGAPPAGIQHDRLKREIIALMRALSQLHPTVLHIDDLHWSDVSTVELLNYVGHQLKDMRVLLVLGYRASQMRLDRHPFLGILPDLQSHHCCGELALPSLNDGEIQEYLDAALAPHRLDAAFTRILSKITEGHPLFLVDLIEDLAQNELIRQEDGIWVLNAPLKNIGKQLPVSVSAVIAHKIGRIEEDDRLLLAAAAMQGVEFDSVIVAGTLSLESSFVEARLQKLEIADSLLRSIRTAPLPDGSPSRRFRFGHALYHAAVDAAIPPTQRSSLALSTANQLIGRYKTHRRAIVAQLAGLFESAGQPIQAIACLIEAGQIAVSLSAYPQLQEIVGNIRRLFGILHEPHEILATELELLNLDLLSASGRKGFYSPEVAELAQRATALAAGSEAHLRYLPPLFFLMKYLAGTGQLRQAAPIATQLIRMAESADKPLLLTHAYFMSGVIVLHRGEPERAIPILTQGLDCYHSIPLGDAPPAHDLDPGVACLFNRARALWLLGYPERSRRDAHDGLELAKRLALPKTLAYALTMTADVAHFCGDLSKTLEFSRQALELLNRLGLDFERVIASALHGWVLAKLGGAEEGGLFLGSEILGYKGPAAPKVLILSAQTFAAAGRLEQAGNALECAMTLLRDRDEHYFKAEALRIQGELLLAKSPSDFDPAVQLFREASDLAESQGTRSLKLRAVLSLSRCLEQNGLPGAAASLQAAYASFEEGFDTADLKEARRVLQGFGMKQPLPFRRAGLE